VTLEVEVRTVGIRGQAGRQRGYDGRLFTRHDLTLPSGFTGRGGP
ncbi:MAG: hypothetical protein QOI55_1981, partial [Actinomycetota bacterium]|nr:hypothetical protein [Actinomycetota bacterium]